MTENSNNSLTISGTITASDTITLDKDTPITFKKYRCKKCDFVAEGVGMWFHKNETVGVDRDYKFCWKCWLQMHLDHCGEVEEVKE